MPCTHASVQYLSQSTPLPFSISEVDMLQVLPIYFSLRLDLQAWVYN